MRARYEKRCKRSTVELRPYVVAVEGVAPSPHGVWARRPRSRSLRRVGRSPRCRTSPARFWRPCWSRTATQVVPPEGVEPSSSAFVMLRLVSARRWRDTGAPAGSRTPVFGLKDRCTRLCATGTRKVWCPCGESNPDRWLERPVHSPVVLHGRGVACATRGWVGGTRTLIIPVNSRALCH